MVMYFVLIVTEQPLYDVFTFDSLKSWFMTIVVFPVAAILYLIVFGLSWLKFKIIQQEK